MESLGLLRMPPMESHVAAHLTGSLQLTAAAVAALAAPTAPGPAVSGGGLGFSSTPGAPTAMGMALEQLNLSALGLSPRVILTIQSA